MSILMLNSFACCWSNGGERAFFLGVPYNSGRSCTLENVCVVTSGSAGPRRGNTHKRLTACKPLLGGVHLGKAGGWGPGGVLQATTNTFKQVASMTKTPFFTPGVHLGRGVDV